MYPSWGRRCGSPCRAWAEGGLLETPCMEGDGWLRGRGKCAEQKGALPPRRKAPWERALSHSLGFFLLLALKGLRRFRVSKIRNKIGGPSSPQLQDWVLGSWQGPSCPCLSVVNCPSQPKMRKRCAAFKTNFICWNPIDWVTKYLNFCTHLF